MQKQWFTVRQLTAAALIAAVYAALSIALAPFSFGEVQCRVSEALTILPVYTTAAIPGLTLGCVIANIFGMVSGSSILGFTDVVLGSAATLVSAFLTRKLREKRWFGARIPATLPPVIINAVVVGGELCYAVTGSVFSGELGLFVLFVGIGQLCACTVLGTILDLALVRAGLSKRLETL